jgi:putative transposase
VVKPSHRKEMAQSAYEHYRTSIRLVCSVFGISESGYHYQARLATEKAEIADWLLRLTTNNKRWGFGLCDLYLRNVKGFVWNHKRVYRIYRELELNRNGGLKGISQRR